MTKDDILKLDSKKHVKIWLLNKLGMSRKEIAEALGTNAGHVGNEIKSYMANKDKREAAETIGEGKEAPMSEFERVRALGKTGFEQQARELKKLKKEKTQVGIMDFVDIVKESKSEEEAYNKIVKIKGVPSEVSESFRKKYDSDGKLSPKQAFSVFYKEIKGEDKKQNKISEEEFLSKIDDLANSKRLSYREAFVQLYGKEAGEFYDKKESEYLGRYTSSFLASEDGMYKSKDAREYANHETGRYFYAKESSKIEEPKTESDLYKKIRKEAIASEKENPEIDEEGLCAGNCAVISGDLKTRLDKLGIHSQYIDVGNNKFNSIYESGHTALLLPEQNVIVDTQVWQFTDHNLTNTPTLKTRKIVFTQTEYGDLGFHWAVVKMAKEGALVNGAIAQGPSHEEGGIKTITPNGPLEIEGGEIVINKEASAKHCQELSKINQSAGGGVAFPCDHKGTDGDKAKLGAEIGDPSNIKFMRWFVGFYKSIDQKMNIQIVLPIKPKDADEWWFPESAETNAVILEVFEKKTWMDAKPFLRTITGKADELGVSIYLEPTPRHQRLNEEQKKKITKEYLTNYYSKFGFKPYKDGYMVRTPNKTASDGAKIPNTSLKQGIEIEKEHTDLYDELSLRLEAEGSKMPMTQDEFFEWIAKAHIKEVPDYYELLKKYIEPTTYTTQELNSWWYGLDSDTQQYLFEDGERDSSWSDRDSDGVWEGLTDRRKAQIMEAMLNPENTAITVKYGLNLVGFDRYGNGIAKHGAKIDDSLLVNDRGYYYRLKESNDGNFTIAELGINGKEKGTLNIPYSFSEQNIYRKANEEEVEDFNKTTEKAKHGTEVEEEEERLEEGDRIIVEYGNQFYGRKGTVEEVRRGFVIVSIDDDEDDDLYSMHSSDVKKIDDDEDDDDSDHDLYAKAGMKIRTKVGPRYDVVYTDRDYKTHTKSFYNDPLGPPENGLEKAKKYEKKLNDEDAKSQYGLYRSVTIKIEHESEASKKPYFLLNKDEVIHERDRLEALPEIKGADYTRLMDIARYSVTKFNTLLSKL